MAIKLREYQTDGAKKLVSSISKGYKKIIFCAATGYGKTILMLDFANRVSERNMKTLIITDRVEILKQTIEKQEPEKLIGYLTPKAFCPETITVAMLQTLRVRLKQEKYQEWLESFDFIFLDECHNYTKGNTFKTICELKSNNCVLIGVSATPFNSKNYLLDGYDDFVRGGDTRDLIELGYLVKCEHYVTELFDFSNVKINRLTNDYDTEALDEIVVDTDKMDKVLENWLPFKDKKTIAFCSSVKIAEEYSSFFRMNGIKANVVSGQTSQSDRETILKDFKNGKIQILFNCNLLTAGFDEPTIECVMFLNKTNCWSKFLQGAGRGLRICPEINKEKCIFLDFVGNTFRLLEVDAIRSYQFAPPKQYKEQDDCDFWECPVCSCVNPIESDTCKECGFIIDYKEDEGKSAPKPKNKKDFERLIKLKSVQQELHDIIFEFNGLPCLVKTEETGNIISGRSEKKWCYGYRENGTPIFKTDKDWNVAQYPYPLITKAKKTNCWYVFHTICINYKPSIGALKYYSSKLRKAKKFLEQIKNPNNKAFVNLYNILN